MILPQNGAAFCSVNCSLRAVALGGVTEPRSGGPSDASLSPFPRREEHEQHGHPVVGHPELGLCRQHPQAEEQAERASGQLHTEFPAVPGNVLGDHFTVVTNRDARRRGQAAGGRSLRSSVQSSQEAAGGGRAVFTVLTDSRASTGLPCPQHRPLPFISLGSYNNLRPGDSRGYSVRTKPALLPPQSPPPSVTLSFPVTRVPSPAPGFP